MNKSAPKMNSFEIESMHQIKPESKQTDEEILM